MKSNILYSIILAAALALSGSAEDNIQSSEGTNARNLRRIPCKKLSRRQCKSSEYCTYSKYERACVNGDAEEAQETAFQPYSGQCQGLSSKRCNITPGCSYDEYYDLCASVDQEEHTGIDEPEPEPYSEVCFGLSRSRCSRNSNCMFDEYAEQCMSWSQGEEGEGDDDCFGKSKRQCNRNSECMYDTFDGVCIPRENANQGGEEGGEQLRALTPPSPDLAPSTPKGWSEMKRKSNRSRGMHFGCACLFPLPYWMGFEGGYFCWCN